MKYYTIKKYNLFILYFLIKPKQFNLNKFLKMILYLNFFDFSMIELITLEIAFNFLNLFPKLLIEKIIKFLSVGFKN